MNHLRSGLLIFAILLSATLADEPAPDGKPAIQEIAPGLFKFGEITINVPKQEISFPVSVNQIEGNLEYVLVNENGKTHESLLATPVKSMDLQVALLLCHFKMSPERVFRKRLSDEEQKALPALAEVPEAQLAISAEWRDHESGDLRREEIHAWIYNDREKSPLKEPKWIFNGIRPQKPGEPPLEENALIAIYLDPFSAINYDGKDNDNDDLWYPTPEKVPAIATPLTLYIRTSNDDAPKTKPS